jgi:hypothetical protein
MAVDTSIKCIVGTDAYVCTRVDLCAALSYEDVTGSYKLSVTLLSTKALRLRVTTVLGRTHTLFMSEELQIHL